MQRLDSRDECPRSHLSIGKCARTTNQIGLDQLALTVRGEPGIRYRDVSLTQRSARPNAEVGGSSPPRAHSLASPQSPHYTYPEAVSCSTSFTPVLRLARMEEGDAF